MTDLFPIKRSAEISPCGNYRYSLSRIWDEGKGCVLWVMLNPSTADAEQDDPTIRKCMGFARRWGYGGIHVANLFNWRSTDPAELLEVDHPYCPPGSRDDIGGQSHGEFVAIVVAWGAVKTPLQSHAIKMLAAMRSKWSVQCVGTTLDGWPRHPLYVPYAAARINYVHSPGRAEV